MYILDEKYEKLNNYEKPSNDFATNFNIDCILYRTYNSLPYIINGGKSDRYILIKALPDDLNEWIITGKTKGITFRILTTNEENELKSMCRRLKLKFRRGRQTMEYMGYTAEIEYPRIVDPVNKTCVSLIPWFMLHRKKYPVFIYLFTYWLCVCQNKSERQSAVAAEQLFGTKIHFSTVSRSIKMAQTLSGTLDTSTTASSSAITFGDILKDIPELLSLKSNLDQPQPSCVGASITLANVTVRFAKFIRTVPKALSTATPPTATSRHKRAIKDLSKNKPTKQKPTQFIDEKNITRVRRRFIAQCRRLVFNVAKRYHKFLI